ncbi:MAG TPA: tyrosine-type recombinase/integrase [Gemmataceae bacterium]|nr:tyrosine-type recombinase/integrase [Gemmataceae bacterium]
MDADLVDYLTYLTKERGCSPRTLDAYRRDLGHWLGFLARQQRTARQVVAADFAAWLKTLWGREAGPSPSTIKRSLSSVKGFYTFLMREERLPDARGIRKAIQDLAFPRIHRKLPDVLTVAEVERLLAAPRPGDRGYARERAILEFLYSTGVRAQELVDATAANVHLKEGFARVMGKGQKERVVPIGSKCAAAINRWLDCRVGHVAVQAAKLPGAESPWLFVGQQGQQLNRLHLYYLVRTCAVQAGIRRPVYPHMLRRSFATHQIENGADIAFVKAMLGHASLSSTEHYLGVAVGKLQDLHARCHPLGGGLEQEKTHARAA